jgi:hypothetical protein
MDFRRLANAKTISFKVSAQDLKSLLTKLKSNFQAVVFITDALATENNSLFVVEKIHL